MDLTPALAATIAQVIPVYAIGLIVGMGARLRASIAPVEQATEAYFEEQIRRLKESARAVPEQERERHIKREIWKLWKPSGYFAASLITRHWLFDGVLLVVALLNVFAFVMSLMVLARGEAVPRLGPTMVLITALGLIGTVLASLRKQSPTAGTVDRSLRP